ncbi:unnamed protein product [Clonostachys byssicola]|uniref:Uncharacterized protein n=1 Tax=Clonostachys byssicola TaxID=160290 RepID=A0A9N9UVW1_9HYPO|nr:unnamed protein product [Clonostachys byssicola]
MYMRGHVYVLGARRALHTKGQGSSYASNSRLPWHGSQAGGLRPKVPFLLWVCGKLVRREGGRELGFGSVTQEQHVADLGTQSGALYAGESKGDVCLVGGQNGQVLGYCMHQGLGLRAGHHLATVAHATGCVRLIYHIAESTCEAVEMQELELEGSSRSGAQGRGRP